MIKFATIGTNFVVDWFLDAAKKVDGLEYVGTYSRNEETAKEFSKKHNGKLIFTDLEEVAKSKEIDAVYVASPNSLHFKQAKLMIENKKHVLIEKTITSNKKELDILVSLARENDVVIMEAMRPVHDPGLAAINNSLYKIAPIRRATIQMCQYSSRYNKYKNGIIENAFNPDFSNGALTDIGVYCVHPMVKLFGKPEKIMAMATILPDSIDGQGTIIAQYEGMLATVMYSKISNGKIPSEIQGEKGSIIIDHIDNPRKVEIRYNDNTIEEIEIVQCESNLIYEATEWGKLISKGHFTDEHVKYSLMELDIMDEARRQQNIVFPADK